MAVTAKWYGKALSAAFNKEIDWNESNKIKLALCTSTYTPDQDAHDYFDDLTNEVATAGGYTAGGAVIASCVVSYTGAGNIFSLTGDPVTWAGSTITARYGIVYYDSGVAATSPLLVYIDFGADVSSSGTDFTVTWPASVIAGGVLA